MAQNAHQMSVKGPDGRPITLEDLPKPGITRWVTRRKAEVVAAVSGGLLSEGEACERYSQAKKNSKAGVHFTLSMAEKACVQPEFNSTASRHYGIVKAPFTLPPLD
eukprot:CAMPEP_0197240182 /NCGR_PEP_ID=MMETSP1429-20130617/6516_1 /TAXON_ID=49237 /ORGANISM="Chaetoceros  sp., Strain UNC1202" /LENGTH=105 /DNA_ID=CAMNT_0042699769 /DNA_START=39 /DNA_END=357 /DNA_ORIENTATION=-